MTNTFMVSEYVVVHPLTALLFDRGLISWKKEYKGKYDQTFADYFEWGINQEDIKRVVVKID